MNSGDNRERRRRGVWSGATFIIICAAMILGMSVFFRVSVIEVTGVVVYTEEELALASGIEIGDNLFFINRSAVGARIISKLPYIETVTIRRGLPSRLYIDVTESAAVARVDVIGIPWAMDSSCKMLGVAGNDELGSLIEVVGISAISPTIGSQLNPGDGEEFRREYLSSILTALAQRDMQGDVSLLDMENTASPEILYLDRFTVRLGDGANLEYKLELLLASVKKLAADDSGTIDLSIDNQAHFLPN